MIVDTTDPAVLQVMVFFERPLTPEQEAKLNYIIDSISELEYDYHENSN
jgi:hypothetical protein